MAEGYTLEAPDTQAAGMLSAMRIPVVPEGREGCWLVEDRWGLKAWIESKGFEKIHNFVGAGPMMLGADHEVSGVLLDIDRAYRVAILTGDAMKGNFNHALALIMPRGDEHEKLEMFDIGDITEDDLEVLAAP